MIRIVRWNEVFENADTRKRQRLGWLSIPTGCDSSGYLSLIANNGGFEAFGIFLAICQWSATQPKDLRGKLVRSNGNPLTEKDIAIRIRAEVCQVSAALKLLSSNDVGWIQWEETEESADNLPLTCHSLPAFVQGEGEGEGEGEGDTRTYGSAQSSIDDAGSEPEKRNDYRDSVKWDSENGFTGITDEIQDRWETAYPACDLTRQIAAANEWLLANPKKRKSKPGRFLVNWLARAQERGGDTQSNATNRRNESNSNRGTTNEGKASQYANI